MPEKIYPSLKVFSFICLSLFWACSLETNDDFELKITHNRPDLGEVRMTSDQGTEVIQYTLYRIFNYPAKIHLETRPLLPRSLFWGFASKLNYQSNFYPQTITEFYKDSSSLDFTVGKEWKNVEVYFEPEMNISPVVLGNQIVYGSNREGYWRIFKYNPATKETVRLTDGPGHWEIDKTWQGAPMALISSSEEALLQQNYVLNLEDYSLHPCHLRQGRGKLWMTPQGTLLNLFQTTLADASNTPSFVISEITPLGERLVLWEMPGYSGSIFGPDNQSRVFIFLWKSEKHGEGEIITSTKLVSFDSQNKMTTEISGWGVNSTPFSSRHEWVYDYNPDTRQILSGYESVDSKTLKNDGCWVKIVQGLSTTAYPSDHREKPLPFLLQGAMITEDGKGIIAQNLQGEWMYWDFSNLRQAVRPATPFIRTLEPDYFWSLPPAGQNLEGGLKVDNVKNGIAIDIAVFRNDEMIYSVTGPSTGE